MLDVLKLFNYEEPILDLSLNKILNNSIDEKFEIKYINNSYILYIDDKQWMMYNDNHMQGAQLFSHYYIAEGDVITTGLGFGIRENWLLKNPKVKSLTVLEKHKKVIDYHKIINPNLFKKANIINIDAKDYIGNCDTLLLDHYEFESNFEKLINIKEISKNINYKKLWFWNLENQIIADSHNIEEDWLWDKFRKNEFKIDMSKFKNIEYIYNRIKRKFDLEKLPNLNKDELLLILSINTSFFQKM
jgi:hypothetical protein